MEVFLRGDMHMFLTLNLSDDAIFAGIWNCNVTFSSSPSEIIGFTMTDGHVPHAFSRSRMCVTFAYYEIKLWIRQRRWWTYARCVTDYFPRDCTYIFIYCISIMLSSFIFHDYNIDVCYITHFDIIIMKLWCDYFHNMLMQYLAAILLGFCNISTRL